MTRDTHTTITRKVPVDQSLYDPEWLGEIQAPTVRAALTVAKIMHINQWRDKAHVSLSYVSHPVAAMNILRADGINQPIVLAAALLHDTLEDCGKELLKAAMSLNGYQPFLHGGVSEVPTHHFEDLTPEEMKIAVEQLPLNAKADALVELLRQNIHEEYISSDFDEATANHMAANSSAEIVDIVRELTNKSADEARFDNKRFYQSDKASRYSKEAAEVKMAEMAASMADDMIHQPNREAPQLIRFYNRCWMMSKASAEQRPSLFKLVRALYTDAKAIALDESLRREPEDFDLLHYTNVATTLPDLHELQRAACWVDNDSPDNEGRMHYQTATSGLLSVALNANNQVAGFRMLTNRADERNLDQVDPVNDIALRFIERLETQENTLVAISRMKEFHNTRQSRKMMLTDAIPFERFTALAMEEGVMEQPFAEQLREKACSGPLPVVSPKGLAAHAAQVRKDGLQLG